MDVGPETFRFPRPTREDLPRLASLAFSTALRCCGACRDYHATWAYLRAFGLSGAGPEQNYPLHIELLSELAAGRGEVRWLLAGSADAGVLATVADVAGTMPGTTHSVTIVDRCPTPLAVCRSHADEHGLALTTVEADLLAFDAPGAFDIVVGHHVVPFFAGETRTAFFRKLESWLAPGGGLFLTLLEKSVDSGAAEFRRRWRVDSVRADAAAGRIALPEDVATFIRRLRRPEIYALRDRHLGIADHAALLRDVGFVVREPVAVPDLGPLGLDGRARFAIIADKPAEVR